MKRQAYGYAAELLRSHGIRATKARTAIASLLERCTRPLSADEIYAKVAHTVDRATVYRTLAALEEAGCVSRFTFQNCNVYELKTTHSHYLICRNCKDVERISVCTLSGLEQTSLKSSKRFASVDHHTLQLSGICRECV